MSPTTDRYCGTCGNAQVLAWTQYIPAESTDFQAVMFSTIPWSITMSMAESPATARQSAWYAVLPLTRARIALKQAATFLRTIANVCEAARRVRAVGTGASQAVPRSLADAAV